MIGNNKNRVAPPIPTNDTIDTSTPYNVNNFNNKIHKGYTIYCKHKYATVAMCTYIT